VSLYVRVSDKIDSDRQEREHRCRSGDRPDIQTYDLPILGDH
jgi:hypothetical protein